MIPPSNYTERRNKLLASYEKENIIAHNLKYKLGREGIYPDTTSYETGPVYKKITYHYTNHPDIVIMDITEKDPSPMATLNDLFKETYADKIEELFKDATIYGTGFLKISKDDT